MNFRKTKYDFLISIKVDFLRQFVCVQPYDRFDIFRKLAFGGC